MPTLIMATDNTEQIVFAPTTTRYGFKLDRLTFAWSRDQSFANKNAIGFAFKPTQSIPNGVYDFEFSRLVGINGYRLISIHPDVISAGFNFPTWGAKLDQITSYRKMSGAAIALGNFGNGGAPRILIDNFYAQSESVLEDVIILSQMTSVGGRNWEFNLGRGRQFLIASCREIHLENVRFEHCRLIFNQDSLCSISGRNATGAILGFEIQSLSVETTGQVYGFDCFGSSVRIDDVFVDSVVETSSGSLRVLRPREGGNIELGGKFQIGAAGLRSIGRTKLVEPLDAKGVRRVQAGRT
ncbi:hypothetical protein [Phenylobacterium aquaticum]|uniref:hypothetical protein n=1 Tax=Phenylobacterium aquaticum TaxID=1763816 RepID=UPI001F5DCBB8|nr:hypothetical protein [Phenylobacterium aquaticum]MCI3135330.1 hypothetical protein [Phenylobacterium aquaticum]